MNKKTAIFIAAGVGIASVFLDGCAENQPVPPTLGHFNDISGTDNPTFLTLEQKKSKFERFMELFKLDLLGTSNEVDVLQVSEIQMNYNFSEYPATGFRVDNPYIQLAITERLGSNLFPTHSENPQVVVNVENPLSKVITMIHAGLTPPLDKKDYSDPLNIESDFIHIGNEDDKDEYIVLASNPYEISIKTTNENGISVYESRNVWDAISAFYALYITRPEDMSFDNYLEELKAEGNPLAGTLSNYVSIINTYLGQDFGLEGLIKLSLNSRSINDFLKNAITKREDYFQNYFTDPYNTHQTPASKKTDLKELDPQTTEEFKVLLINMLLEMQTEISSTTVTHEAFSLQTGTYYDDAIPTQVTP